MRGFKKGFDDGVKTELKPCPFCGSEAKLFSAYDGTWTVQCTKCGCGTLHYTDEITAPIVWNRRVGEEETT